MARRNMSENRLENKGKRSGRTSKSVTLKFSPKIWEKFKELVRREELTYGLALEILMGEAIERGYIIKVREQEEENSVYY